MFTGIVQGKTQIQHIEEHPSSKTLQIVLPVLSQSPLQIGASVAINGVCLTVTSFEAEHDALLVSFDVIEQTLALTNLGLLSPASWVNFERSMRLSDEIGGHQVSGHVDTTVTLQSMKQSSDSCYMHFSFPENLAKYLFSQGFVALNGCSLTIAAIDYAKSELTIALIPETLESTIFGELQVGDKINLELERQTQAVVDTVERILQQRLPQ